jgi:hypothetical protein
LLLRANDLGFRAKIRETEVGVLLSARVNAANQSADFAFDFLRRSALGSRRLCLVTQLAPHKCRNNARGFLFRNRWKTAGGGTAIDHLSSLSLDLRNVLGADVTVGIDPQGGDAGGAKVVFREEFVARWLAHAQGNEKLICERSVKMLLETPPRSAHGNCGGGARAGRRLEANANAQIQR